MHRTAIAISIFLSLSALYFSQFLGSPLDKRYLPSGLNSHFNFTTHHYPGYLKHIKNIILSARVDLNRTNKNTILHANMPFELLPPSHCPASSTNKDFRRGILLIHGLSDSPYGLRHLASIFQQQCFYVITVLLPGHGTRPADLLTVDWQDWVAATHFGTSVLKHKVDEPWLGGYSAGATLALYQASQDPDIQGLMLFSPAIRLPALAAYAHWQHKLSYLWHAATWLQRLPDDDPYKYESLPINAVVQLYQLIQSLNTQSLPSLPIFIAASEDDVSVDSLATLELFKQWRASTKKLLWFSRDLQAQQGRLEIIASQASYETAGKLHEIASSSHLSLLIPATDPHYGENGQYAACGHYYPVQMQDWQRCKERNESLLGEISPYFLAQGNVRRLTFNPHFAYFKQTLIRFINNLP